MGTVSILHCVTSLPIPVERVLDSAKHLTRVLVIGEDEDGNEYFAGSHSGGPENLWMLERARHKLLRIVDED